MTDARQAEPRACEGTNSPDKRKEIDPLFGAFDAYVEFPTLGRAAITKDHILRALSRIETLEDEVRSLRIAATPPDDAQRFSDAACATDVPRGFGQHVDGTDGLRSGTNIASAAEWRDFFVALFERLAPGWSPPMKWGCRHKTTHAEQLVPCPVCHPWASHAEHDASATASTVTPKEQV